jgi:hypothetical protein
MKRFKVFLTESHDELHEESEYQGKKVTLNKPFRTPDGPKKFSVYVKNDKGNVVKVNFGDPNMEIKRDDPERRANYRARHNCDDPGPKWKANYWSCKMWSSKPVSKIAENVDVSQAAKLFSKFLRTTGAPDKVSTFTTTKKNVFKGQSAKWEYVVDMDKKTVSARQRSSMNDAVYVWDDKTNAIKIVESNINLTEAAPPDAEVEQWIKNNKERFKKEYGAEEGEKILYAKAWKMYNDKK